MIIEVDSERMNPATKIKVNKLIKHLERVGKQANRDTPGVFKTFKNTHKRVIGMQKIQNWALQNVKAIHLNFFSNSIGSSICNLIFNHKCDVCPAKRYKWNQEKCRTLLGVYALTEFDKEGEA